jgi:hypothetical protein
MALVVARARRSVAASALRLQKVAGPSHPDRLTVRRRCQAERDRCPASPLAGVNVGNAPGGGIERCNPIHKVGPVLVGDPRTLGTASHHHDPAVGGRIFNLDPLEGTGVSSNEDEVERKGVAERDRYSVTAPSQVGDDFGLANLAFVGCQAHLVTIRTAWDRSCSGPSTVVSTWLTGLLSRTTLCPWRLSFTGQRCA